MACELDDAFDNARNKLPDGWFFTSFINDSGGWLVSAAKRDSSAAAVGDIVWYPRIEARAGLLTKALNRLADKLEEHVKKTP